MYTIPDDYCLELHHVRPRFKNDVENVLFYIASVCKNIKTTDTIRYNEQVFNAIKLYPGNENSTRKTINNWRTEIAALFGFYIEDKVTRTTRTGAMSNILAETGDLIQFFKYYAYKFQYPGGHVKKEYVKELIDAGVRFKPAQYILKLLHEADTYQGKPLGISKAEATHCIFNDLRVTRDHRDVKDVIDLISRNRKSKVCYDTTGDVIRYAGDILDYMVLANLLKESHNYYYLNRQENEAILAFINSNDYFDGYDEFYDTSFAASCLGPIETDWFEYVNTGLDSQLFKTDISQYIAESSDVHASEYSILVKDKIGEVLASASTKEIGDLGETLVVGHEKVRVKEGGREDLLHLIKKIPTAFAVGYDVQSIELDAKKRYIEVKTTISSKPINFYTFHLTPNEWDTASSLNDRYFVYRLMISKSEITIYILQNPVQMYKENRISLSLRDGAEITFNAANCEKSSLKIWKE